MLKRLWEDVKADATLDTALKVAGIMAAVLLFGKLIDSQVPTEDHWQAYVDQKNKR